MTAFDEGSLGDRSFGESVSLTETVVVMTSNLLADRWQELRAMGDEELRNHLVVHGGLKSELLGRVDEVLVFSALDQKALAEIVKRRLDGLKASLYSRGLDLEYDQLLPNRILELTGKGGYGVRQVDQVISAKVAGPIMDALQGPNGGKSIPASQKSRRKAYVYPATNGSIAVTLNREVWTQAPRWKTISEAQAMASRGNLLRERVVGQDQALELIEKHVLAAAKGLRVRPNRPLFSVLLLGPTGVGKTETAKAMAEMIFGSPDAMVRLDMAEFNGPMAANRLYGSPQGMAGGGAGGELTRPVRSNGRRLVLMDEVEKADPFIWDPMMTVFDEGFLTEAGTGRAVSFRDTVLVMTSNLLADQADQLATLGSEDLRDVLVRTGQFRKEFLGRLDRIVVFKRLDLKALETIASRRLEAMMANTRHQLGLEVHWTPGVVSLLALQAGQARYGVRRIDEVIGDSVILPLSAYVDGLGGEERAKGADAFLRLDRDGCIIVENHAAPDDSKPVADIAPDDLGMSETLVIVDPSGRKRPFGPTPVFGFAPDIDVAPTSSDQGDLGFSHLDGSMGFESDKHGGPVEIDETTWKRAKDRVSSGGRYGDEDREKLRPKKPLS
jgi:ATP-dependent Clp protease ATP-binding subunit ClpA